jgi:hypothetical protein
MQQGSTNNARHRRKPWTPERKQNPVNDGGLRNVLSRHDDDDDDDDNDEQHPHQHRSSPHAAFSSSWRICLFRMIHLRWLQERATTCPKGRRRVLAFLVLFLAVIVPFQPPLLRVFFWGDGYHVDGGIIGRAVDHIVAVVLYYERYSSSRHTIRLNDDGSAAEVVEYPIVKLRNRKEIPGYSRYLEEILTRRRHSDTVNKNVADAADWYTTSRGASLDASIRHASNVQEWMVAIQEPEITVNDNNNAANVVPAARHSVADRLRENGCQPGWICHRCLAVPWWGSLEQCSSSWACPPCFSNLLCSSDDSMSSSAGREPTFISIQAHVKGNSMRANSPRQGRSTIPRIVHVVGGQSIPSSSSSSPSLDLLQYPELVRIQNGWRAAGYSYRYYTPKSARAFVQQHYPNRFLHVYDALQQQSSEFDQQHFFRLLVLFQQGGIVANGEWCFCLMRA